MNTNETNSTPNFTLILANGETAGTFEMATDAVQAGEEAIESGRTTNYEIV